MRASPITGRNYPTWVTCLAEGASASGDIEIRKIENLAPVAAPGALPSVG